MLRTPNEYAKCCLSIIPLKAGTGMVPAALSASLCRGWFQLCLASKLQGCKDHPVAEEQEPQAFLVGCTVFLQLKQQVSKTKASEIFCIYFQCSHEKNCLLFRKVPQFGLIINLLNDYFSYQASWERMTCNWPNFDICNICDGWNC